MSRVPQMIPAAFAWAGVVAVGGGFGCGFLMSVLSTKTQWGIVGGILLWGLGAVAGVVSRKITRAPCPPVAWALVVACVVAFGLAEVSWYHWSFKILDEVTKEFRPQTWGESLARTPGALWDRAQVTLLLGVFCCAFGAHEAYRKAGKRYRIVAIAED